MSRVIGRNRLRGTRCCNERSVVSRLSLNYINEPKPTLGIAEASPEARRRISNTANYINDPKNYRGDTGTFYIVAFDCTPPSRHSRRKTKSDDMCRSTSPISENGGGMGSANPQKQTHSRAFTSSTK